MAAVKHLAHPKAADFEQLTGVVRESEDEPIVLYVLGAPIQTTAPFRDLEEINAEHRGRADGCIEAFNALNNVTLKAFDVYDKKKPYAVVIDARNGRVIRGSKLLRTTEQAEYEFEEDGDGFLGCEEFNSDFDGRLPAYQKP